MNRSATMMNKRMAERLEAGEAIDVSKFKREDSYFILPEGSFAEGADYCDAKEERWIWSIGRRNSDGVILASYSADLYQNPNFTCMWLR